MSETTIDRKNLAVDITGFFRDQERCALRDFARCSIATLRNALVPLCAHVFRMDGPRQRRIDGARRDGIDTNSILSKLGRKYVSEQIDGPFRGAVSRPPLVADEARHGGNIDDRTGGAAIASQ